MIKSPHPALSPKGARVEDKTLSPKWTRGKNEGVTIDH